jgi:hypothetical protein
MKDKAAAAMRVVFNIGVDLQLATLSMKRLG